MNCPSCGYYNPAGQTPCFHCGLALPLSAGLGDAKCALHLDLAAIGACSRCGTFGCSTCLTQQDGAWLCPSCRARGSVLPWDERETLGLWRAWWRTSMQLMTSPSQTLSSAQPDGSLGSSMGFATLASLVAFVPTMGLLALATLPLLLFGPTKANADAAARLIVPVVVLGYGAFLFVTQIASVLVLAAIDHVVLLLLGAQPKSFAVSVRAAALSLAPNVLGLLPFCSFVVFPFWSPVLRIIALMHLHKTTPGRAIGAVLLPVALCVGGVTVFYVALFAALGRDFR